MFQNFTILLLQLTSLSSKSPLFSPSATSMRSFSTFHNLYLSKHASTFLHINSNQVSSIISNSNFNFFLDSVIRIQLENFTSYTGFSKHTNDPLSPYESFQIQSTTFSNNTSPFNGGAILVHSFLSAINSITGLLNNTVFTSNSAMMGGAIFFESTNFTAISCTFSKNSALIGCHAFLSSTSTIQVSDTTFQESPIIKDCNSSIEVTGTASTYVFDNCHFFLNNAPFRTNNVDVTVSDSCFMFYEPDEYTNYNFSILIATLNTGSFIFNDVIANNRKYGPSTSIGGSEDLTTKGDSATDNSGCRVIPSPSASANYGIKSEPAIFSIVAIAFFFIVSIVGIFIVACQNKKNKEKDDESEIDKQLNPK